MDALMENVWITAGNLLPSNIINPILAASDEAVSPKEIHILTPSKTREQVEKAVPVLKEFSAHEGDTMEINLHVTPNDPHEFTGAATELFPEIEESTVALDITGRPSVYATLLFQQAVANNVDADHVYYLDQRVPLDSTTNALYPEVPTTAFRLRDILSDFEMGPTNA